ncbi:MAG: DUF2127 domain-containing protein [Chlorobiales bacterium]|nr:DUF2127 domain-containing protein [Chlorobiales bacterium]
MALKNNMKGGLKVVAIFEAFKGILVLFTGVALFSLMHQDIQAVAEQLVHHMHLNPAKHIPKIFIEASRHLENERLRSLALLAFLYSSMRFIEAYGLWFEKVWSEWFALLSGGIYLPIELFELAKGISLIKIMFTSINLIVVLYMAFMLKQSKKAPTTTNPTGF